ncbi:MAG: thioredoxin family protein [Pseudomonadota bacterium]
MTLFTRRLALVALMIFGLAAVAPHGADARTVTFTPATYNKLLKSGKPFMIGVHTKWCTTCAAQKRVIRSLRRSGKPYANLTVLEMDWDKYRGSKIGKQLRIPRRSTLVMYSGGREVGRIIAGTGTGSIKRLINKGYKGGA